MFTIGLFPLNMVLFPESALPLHIFEEKYKMLINLSIDSGEPFGINLVDSNKISDVGCTALVSDIIKKYDDGKMDILISGLFRYKIISYEETEYSYFRAQAEIFDDRQEVIDTYILESCINIYNEIADMITAVKINKLDTYNLKTKKPSFLIAQKAGLTLPQKQNLLEMDEENERLKLLHFHLNRVLPMLKETEYIQKIIKNDGYLNSI